MRQRGSQQQCKPYGHPLHQLQRLALYIEIDEAILTGLADGELVPQAAKDEAEKRFPPAWSLGDWAAVLYAGWPKLYREPPPPQDGIVMRDRERRVSILAARVAAGVGLRHPDDVAPERDCEKMGRKVSVRPGNHHSAEEGLVRDDQSTQPTPTEPGRRSKRTPREHKVSGTAARQVARGD